MSVRPPPIVVLVHGFLGFEASHLAFRLADYFRGVERLARARGLRCVCPRLPASGAQEDRTAALARALERLGDGPIALIGHSQGGIDAAVYAARHDRSRRVRRVVTIGTPHRGSVVADRLLTGRSPLARVAQRHWAAGLRDLTPEVCERRLAGLEPHADVAWESHAGARPPEEQPVWLRPFGRMHGEPNDGLVTVASALWEGAGPVLAADHFELAGWSLGAWPSRRAARPFPHLRLYGAILDAVAAEG